MAAFTQRLVEQVRKYVAPIEVDRIFSNDMEKLSKALKKSFEIDSEGKS